MSGLGSTTSRSKVFGFAASLALASYGAFPSISEAKEPIAPACMKAGGELAQLRCSIAVSKKATAAYNAQTKAAEARGAAADARTAAADARSEAADARSAAADRQSRAEDKRTAQLTKAIAADTSAKSCYDGILQEVRAAKLIGPLTPLQKNAFKARAAECEKS